MLKVHIGLSLASRMKQLHWSYSSIILDEAELWQEILCEIGLPLLDLILFQISKHEYLQSRQKCLLLNKAMETTSLQATGCARHGAAGWGIPAVMGKCRRRHRGALRSSPGRKPSAGISPKDGTEHGLSIPVTRPEKNSKGFMYETQDPFTSGTVSQRDTGAALLLLSHWESCSLEGRQYLRACSRWWLCADRQTHCMKYENLAAKILKFPNLIHYTLWDQQQPFPQLPRHWIKVWWIRANTESKFSIKTRKPYHY